MEIYRLSGLGYRLAHTVRHEDTPGWRVIHYLAKMHTATKDKLLSEVPGVTGMTLAKLRMRKIVVEETGVEV